MRATSFSRQLPLQKTNEGSDLDMDIETLFTPRDGTRKERTVAYPPGEACPTEKKNKVTSGRVTLNEFVAIVNVTHVLGCATITDAAAEVYNSLIGDPRYLDTDKCHIFY